jgi:cobalamin 5'-phosphate synthase/cobalamin synthase
MKILKGLVTAFRTLTVLPVPGTDSDRMASSLPWFPFVGGILGVILYALGMVIGLIDHRSWPEGSALVLIGCGILLTKGLHLDGLSDCADAFGNWHDRKKTLEIMKDPRTGAFGVISIVFILLVKWVSLTRLTVSGGLECIISAYIISRTMQVEMAVSFPYAREEGGTGAPFIRDARAHHRFAALGIACAMLVFLNGPVIGFIIPGVAWGVCRLLGLWSYKRIKGVTGDLLGACSELIETLTLFLCALFWRKTAFLTILLSIFSCGNKNDRVETVAKTYSRIISFAPSITETLFELSLGDKVVGVSNFCAYPPGVQKIMKVGGYTDPDYEAILRLKPDLVVLLQEHVRMFEFLKKNRIDFMLVDNQNLSSILESFRLIGKKCGKSGEADKLVKLILSEVVADGAGNSAPPKVFLCVDRENQGCGRIFQAYAAGEPTFYNDLMKMAGLSNAVVGLKIPYPQISMEGIIALQPDIIIDVAMRPGNASLDRTIRDWQSLDMVPAVKNKMIFCLKGDYLTVPGPRIYMILADFKRILSSYRQSKEAH